MTSSEGADDGNRDSSAHRTRVSAVSVQRYQEGKDLQGLGSGDSQLLVGLLTPEEADEALAKLSPGGEVEYQQWYHMPDQRRPQEPLKRLQRVKVAMADPDASGTVPWYRFPVNNQQEHGVLPMSPTVTMLRQRIEKKLGITFNHSVVLFYRDGDECIGYHKDKTLDLDENAPIVSVSLGHPGRPYVLRDDIFKPQQPETEVLLPHGGVFVLGPQTNRDFYHAVRQTSAPAVTAPRVSVTFRVVSTFRLRDGTLTGQGAMYQSPNWPEELGGWHKTAEGLGPPPKKPPVQRAPVAEQPHNPATQGLPQDQLALVKSALEEVAASVEVASFLKNGDWKSAKAALASALAQRVSKELAEHPQTQRLLGRSLSERVAEVKSSSKPSAAPQLLAPGRRPALEWCPCALLSLARSAWLSMWEKPDDGSDPQRLLEYWFGAEPYAWRGGLWWRGVDPSNGLGGIAATDRRICRRYGALIRSCREGLSVSKVEKWQSSPQGLCALVLLLDQFPRNAFRGTSEMFAYDHLAQAAARQALLQEAALAWPHHLFCLVALMHSEDIAVVEEAAAGLLSLAKKLEQPQSSRVMGIFREAKEHALVLQRFGRYPHRNACLGRASAPVEVEWLRSKKLPGWARSTGPIASIAAAPAPAARKAAAPVPVAAQRKLKLLVLHSNRQSAASFRRKTQQVFEPLAEVAELHFAQAPHVYKAQGEALEQGAAADEASEGRGFCWWNATDDPATMKYVGLEESLEYLEGLFLSEGPFDGLLGFSQGGSLAGLLAAMQPVGSIRFQFCIIISGFYCRDVERCLLQLESVPAEHRPELLHARLGAVKMPSFHSWGLSDTLVHPWRSQVLSSVFQDPVVQPHEADHFTRARAKWPIAEIAGWLRRDIIPGLSLQGGEDRIASSFRVLKAPGPASKRSEALAQLALELGSESSADRRKVLLQVVAMEAAGWPALVQLDSLVVGEEGAPPVPLAEEDAKALRADLAALFAEQLHADLLAAAAWKAWEKLPREDGQTWASEPPMPSECAKWAPRFGGALDKRTRLALRVAAAVSALRHGLPPEVPEDSAELRQQQPILSREYRELLRQLLDTRRAAETLWRGPGKPPAVHVGAMTDERFAELLAAPVSEAVLHPIPEPLEISPSSELMPLLSFLESGNGTQGPNTRGDIVFQRGTVTSDGRLDLCKQVVGPDGVDALVEALGAGGAGAATMVLHLLLGNNLCGDRLPARIAELITSGKSRLSTWYIAGNCLSGDSLVPLCDALAHDTQVRQLWLKRNPLHAPGARHLSGLLSINRTIQVLDLVNCGLLDEGAEALAPGLKSSVLQHLYLDGNGISAKGAAAIAGALQALTEQGRPLFTLSMGMNRLRDDGAAVLARGAQGLTRLCVASCGISGKGAKALAELLKGESSLRFLDLGLLKATAALGEAPNRIGNQGAEALAAALATNSRLNGLLLVCNTIFQGGLAALARALETNRSIVRLELEQFGIPLNELTKEDIRLSLSRNRRLLEAKPEEEQKEVQEALDPAHLEEIRSVYRLGNTYSPDADI